jgi:hypothetical protein
VFDCLVFTSSIFCITEMGLLGETFSSDVLPGFVSLYVFGSGLICAHASDCLIFCHHGVKTQLVHGAKMGEVITVERLRGTKQHKVCETKTLWTK